jgi:hypothetical protein
MLAQRACLGVDCQCRNEMVGLRLSDVVRRGVAARHIKIASRFVRPRILDAAGQRHGLVLGQFRAGNIDVVMNEVGPDIGVERDLLRRLLSGDHARRRYGSRGKRQKRPPADHRISPQIV